MVVNLAARLIFSCKSGNAYHRARVRTRQSRKRPEVFLGLFMLLICPILAFRRAIIDHLHTGEPHQLDPDASVVCYVQQPVGL
jgi:hypothetical protein